MNPKDMTNEALLDAWLKEMKGDYEHGCPCESEVQRRLNEADALRKENAELRKDAERYRFIRDNADTIAINSSLQYCDIFRSEGIEDGLDIAMKFESDYAAKARESEASHE